MNFTAYFDESGTHDGSESVVVAGYVSTADQWVEFSAQWQLALNDFGLNHFHMTDFANKAPPYDTWTEEERRQCLSRLLPIISANTLASQACIVPKRLFDSTFSNRAKAICGDAYGLAATSCFLVLSETLRSETIDGWISYVFESGARGAGALLRVFQSNMKDPDRKTTIKIDSLVKSLCRSN